MNATAKSGSMPELHPAMMEMVPVGATVVTLQLRRRRIGRMAPPLGPREAVFVGAPDAPLPLGENAALGRQSLRFDLRFFIDELLNLAAERDALFRVIGNA